MTAPSRTRLLVVRGILWSLAGAALSVGIPATVAPRSFFDEFPWAANWVSRLPPYNEHLVTDVGGLQLAFGLLFVWAAVRPERALAVPVCIAWSISQLLHLTFHVMHFGSLTFDVVAQTASLAYLAAAPWLVALLLVRPLRSPASSAS